MRGMAFTAQADPTTFATQPCPIVPEAEHAACLQLPTQCRGQSACQLSTGRKKTRPMHKLSASLLEPNGESGKVAGAVATADFTSL